MPSLKMNFSPYGKTTASISNRTDEQVSTNEKIVGGKAAEQDGAVGDLGAQEVKPHRGKNGG